MRSQEMHQTFMIFVGNVRESIKRTLALHSAAWGRNLRTVLLIKHWKAVSTRSGYVGYVHQAIIVVQVWVLILAYLVREPSLALRGF